MQVLAFAARSVLRWNAIFGLGHAEFVVSIHKDIDNGLGLSKSAKRGGILGCVCGHFENIMRLVTSLRMVDLRLPKSLPQAPPYFAYAQSRASTARNRGALRTAS
jgi:hypothetical protein